MPRAVWTGSLSFGLVSIPVALYPATEPKDVRFHLFDREGRRVHYRRVVDGGSSATDEGGGADRNVAEEPEATAAADPTEAPSTRSPGAASPAETEVAFQDLVRGYEVEQDRYVFVESEEIERVKPTRSTTIDLEDFVRLDDIDPVFFEKSYFVVPRPGAEKPYLLLLRTLERTGLVGIGRFVLRTKPHLVALRPRDGALGLETLYFGDEVRTSPNIGGEGDVSERELLMAEQLVGMLATDWDPSRYADTYRQELLRIIEERMPEEVPVEAEGTTQPGRRVEELMEALRSSVEEAKKDRAEGSSLRRSS
jgi:DNA end-binding protein Ku